MNQKQIELETLIAGTSLVISLSDLQKKLESSEKLIIKLGADPTSPNLHLGHAIVLRKLRQFQNYGHKVIFLIGDFTARIGDPTGRSKTRPPLNDEQIAENSLTYFEQVRKILDPQKMEIRYNSEWLNMISSTDWVKLCGRFTLAQLIERSDFSQRISEHQPIAFHELLYPIMQAYDSVALHASVELGGTDQLFNLLMGRFLQEQFGQEPQVVMTMPLLEGIDGKLKMSKSYGNSIGLTDSADQAYGKIMSISDDLMWRYYALLLQKDAETISSLQGLVASSQAHPMELKKELAQGIIEQFWSAPEAAQAAESFTSLFQNREFEHAQTISISSFQSNPVWIVQLVKDLALCSSMSEARRLINAGAVSINGEKKTDCQDQILIIPGMLIKIGKHRFYRVE